MRLLAAVVVPCCFCRGFVPAGGRGAVARGMGPAATLRRRGDAGTGSGAAATGGTRTMGWVVCVCACFEEASARAADNQRSLCLFDHGFGGPLAGFTPPCLLGAFATHAVAAARRCAYESNSAMRPCDYIDLLSWEVNTTDCAPR